MTLKKNPKRIAQALYSVSESNNVLEPVYKAFSTLYELVQTDSEFRVFIQSKRISRKNKAEILNNVLGEFGHPLIAELIFHLDGSKILNQFKEVKTLFERYYKASKNIVSVEGTLANPLDEAEVHALKSSLDNALGKNTDLTIKIDESLIGGIRLRIENTFLDATVQNQLHTLKKELLQ
tara:strand:- start:1678 stop:2214 length:537 start_codon:yes stop_codon:yes gene_type:complete